MKYTDEQLSRILSAAAVSGGLVCGGIDGPGLPCCMVQAADLWGTVFTTTIVDPERAQWFDTEVSTHEYDDPDAMLRALERKGWA